MSDFMQFKRRQVAELRPWCEGDDLTGVSISAEDAKAGSPRDGDMIARNPNNHKDQWLVASAYFAENFEPMSASDDTTPIDNAYCAIAVASLREWLRDAFVAGQNADPVGSEVYADLAIRSYLDPERKL